MIGSKLGDYEVIRMIGRGGMGAVYEAVNSRIGRRVAIKVLLPDYADRADVVRRFLNEAKAVNAINHPGVVQVSDVDKAPDGSLYLVMEYLEGATLSERLQSAGGKLFEEETVTISWQLAGVLSAAHAKSIIHRDLKPGNVMIVPDMAGPGGERVKLLDFGIAKLGAEHFHGEEVKTRTGQVMGTAGYMSPEQFMGDRVIDGQSDVYSLGVVMFKLLAGRMPFVSNSGEMGLAAMHMFQKPPPLHPLAPDTSAWLVSLIEQMLAKEPEQRPTMAQVVKVLQEHLPFRAPSRTSMPSLIGLESSGLLRLNSLDPTAAGDGPFPPSGDVVAVGSSKLSSGSARSGTITRATGEASVSEVARMRRRSMLIIASLCVAVVGASVVVGFQRFGKPSYPPGAATRIVTVNPPDATGAPANANPGALPDGGAKASPTKPAADNTGQPPDDSDGTHRDDKGHKIRGSNKMDGKRDGKPRSPRKPQSTVIIN